MIRQPSPQGISRSYSTLAEARRLPYWRDPALPEGWILESALIPNDGPRYGYCARFRTEERTRGNNEVYRNYAFRICGLHITGWYHPDLASWHDGASVRETRVVAGRPAMVIYSPEGPDSNPDFPINIWVHDPETATDYHLVAGDGSISGSNIEAAIAIVQGLFEPPNPLPPPTTFRYDTYDNAGEVAEPGSYAFLADPADTTSAVSTYEALRDGTATALLIHKSDAHGASQAALYDAVEAGDVVEWREADDCWTRYEVTAVLPDPPGDTSRKEFAIRWYSYSATGCAGAIDAMAGAGSFNWVPPNIQSITAPVRYGPYFMHPSGWTGDFEDVVRLDAQSTSDGDTTATPGQPTWPSEDPAEVRMHPLWRDPVLPAGWALLSAHAVEDWWLVAWYTEADGYLGARVLILRRWWRPIQKEFIRYSNGLGHELRLIDGRPAVLWYHLDGQEVDVAQSAVAIFDETTGVEVIVEMFARGVRNDLEAIIAIARSLFGPPNPLPPQTALRYDTYDTTGEVAEPGSYAFLLADGGSTTAAATWVDVVNHRDTTHLRVHSSDAEGTSQAPFYRRVAVGDEFDWWMSRQCYFRFRVTELLPDVPGADMRKTFAIEHVTSDIYECSTERQDPAQFRWNPPEAVLGPDGVLQMITGVPVPGGQRYRLAPWSPVTVDVPAGMRLVRYTTLVLNPDGTWTVGLERRGEWIVSEARHARRYGAWPTHRGTRRRRAGRVRAVRPDCRVRACGLLAAILVRSRPTARSRGRHSSPSRPRAL